jgi:hypothetical protein
MWPLIAHVIARPAVARWLIRRAMRTPYFHLDGYMERWWIVPYGTDIGDGTGCVSWWRRPFAWLLQRFDIAIRVHHILRADNARDPHDHPWNARTVILDGCYIEEREGKLYTRIPGDTATLNFGEYHRILTVSDGGVWTLFITGRKRGTWGFLVNGEKIHYRDYTEQTGYTT